MASYKIVEGEVKQVERAGVVRVSRGGDCVATMRVQRPANVLASLIRRFDPFQRPQDRGGHEVPGGVL
jgi:hypothetical protein